MSKETCETCQWETEGRCTWVAANYYPCWVEWQYPEIVDEYGKLLSGGNCDTWAPKGSVRKI